MVRFNADCRSRAFVNRAVAIALAALVAACASVQAAQPRTIVARPETRTTVGLGDVIVFPIYDSRHAVMAYGSVLERLGARSIARHDLWNDMHLKPPPSWHMSRALDDAASDRGEAFRAIRRGSGSANVLLTLPRMKQQCVSCRTVHYFVTVR